MFTKPMAKTNLAIDVPRFALAVFRVTFRVLEPMPLGVFWGATLRGALGHALRQTHCLTGVPTCEGCALTKACNYAYLFETYVGSDVMGVRDCAPHPFVVQVPPPDRPTTLKPGAYLQFGLTLFGDAATMLPAITPALHHLGQRGLGVKQARCELVGLERSWLPDRDRWVPVPLNGHQPAPTLNIQAPEAPGAVRVSLATPLRLKVDKQIVSPRTFTHQGFLRALVRRVHLLQRHFITPAPNLDHRPVIAEIAHIQMPVVNLYWRTLRRWSGRQHKRLHIDGLMGWFELTGPGLQALWPYLYLGGFVNVGKATSLGLGSLYLEPAQHLNGRTP